MGVNTVDKDLFDIALNSFDPETVISELAKLAHANEIFISGIAEFQCLFPQVAEKLRGIENIYTSEKNNFSVPVRSYSPGSTVYFLGLQVGGIESYPTFKAINLVQEKVFAPVQLHFSLSIRDSAHSLIEPYFTENIAIKSSLIVLSGLNNAGSLEVMLGSLKKFTKPQADREIIVVVNGSDDYSSVVPGKILNTEYNLKVIVLPENRGIAGGYNAGMNAASGKYTVLMQDDITFSNSKWLDELEYYMDTYPEIGLLGGFRGGYYFKNNKTALSGDLLSPSYIGIGSELFGKCKWDELKDNLVQVHSVNCMLTIHRSGLAYYDEELLPNGIEDIAFAFEIRKRGYEVFTTNSGITHGDLVSASRKETRFSRLFKLIKKKSPLKSGVTKQDLMKRLSRGYHFSYFTQQYGAMLSEMPDGDFTLEKVAKGYKRIPRSKDFNG